MGLRVSISLELGNSVEELLKVDEFLSFKSISSDFVIISSKQCSTHYNNLFIIICLWLTICDFFDKYLGEDDKINAEKYEVFTQSQTTLEKDVALGKME